MDDHENITWMITLTANNYIYANVSRYFKAGEEVYLIYKLNDNNSNLLRSYGFYLDDMEFESYNKEF